MKTSTRHLVRALCTASVLAVGIAPKAHAGIPVIDVANLTQAIEGVLNDLTQISNQITSLANEAQQIEQMYTQIDQMDTQLTSINGFRGLGTAAYNAALDNYMPDDVNALLANVSGSGYSGLTSSARDLRDSGMVYNCEDREGAEKTRCQADLAMGYQTKALLNDAMTKLQSRRDQITSLMSQIDMTSDPKAIAEVQARITAENALLANEQTKLDAANQSLQAEIAISQSRAKEAELEAASRTFRMH